MLSRTVLLIYENAKMLIELREYTGIYFFETLAPEEIRRLQQLTLSKGLHVTITDSSLEMEYSGRDTDRWIVSYLCQVAEIVKDAQGEIECRYNDDEQHETPLDSMFEFYSIRNGELFRQKAEIVRGASERMC